MNDILNIDEIMKLLVVLSFICALSMRLTSGSTLQQFFSTLEEEVTPEWLTFASVLDKQFSEEMTNNHDAILSSRDLEDVHFHSNNCTVRTWGGRMFYNGKGKRTHTDLRRRTVRITLVPDNLTIDTKFRANRLAFGDLTSSAVGSARTTYKALKCEGLAALEFESQLSIEWVQLFCNTGAAQIETDVETDGVIWGKELEEFIHGEFGKALEAALERDVTTSLEEVVSSWLQSRIDILSSFTRLSYIITNEAYQEATEKEVIEANEVLDGILSFASAMIRENYNDSIRIPDIREGFERNVRLISVCCPNDILFRRPNKDLWNFSTEIWILHVVTIGAQFLATQGRVYGVSSIERVGSARLQRNASSVYFSSTFRFKELYVMYDRYKVEIVGVGPTGSISTSVAPVAARIVVHVDFMERKAYLDRLRIAQLGKVNVKITGLGLVLNAVVSRIVTWVIAAFKNQVLNLVEARVRRLTRETLAKSSLDDILSGRAFAKRR